MIFRKIAGISVSIAVLAFLLFGLGGCKSSTTPGTEKTFESTLNNGHTHAVTITQADVQSPPAAGISLVTSMDSGHTHTFDMTQAQLMTLNGGTAVTVTTGVSDVTGAHTHDFALTKWF